MVRAAALRSGALSLEKGFDTLTTDSSQASRYCQPMQRLSYRRHRFSPVIIQHAVRLYLRSTLSYRDIEKLLAERGIDVSNETIRRWVPKFARRFAQRLRRSSPDLPQFYVPVPMLVLACFVIAPKVGPAQV
jgi:hypothetical protein